MPSRDPTAARAWVRPVQAVALAGLLATPLVVAFFEGGYTDEPRLWALLASALVSLLVAVAAAQPLPARRRAWLALAGLWGLTAWTALSISWAPLRGPAFHDAQRLLVYSLSFTAGIASLRQRAFARAVEPVFAAGLSVILAYGLAGRLLPGLVHESHEATAAGRLDQPLTYWNAEGTLAALTIVLCTRLAGDGTRRTATRIAAAAACAPAGMALYLSYSRGALGAAAAGLLILLAVTDRRQLRAAAVCVSAAVLGALVAVPFPLVASLSDASRVQGVAALTLLIAVAAAAAAVERTLAQREAGGRLRTDRDHMRTLRPLLAAGVVVVVVGFVIATAAAEHRSASSNPATGATATRLASVQSHRYAYWKVALGAFADHPLRGLGSGGFGVRWLQKRTFREAVHDAHSLYIETAAELGVVGLALLALLIAAVISGARATVRADAVLAAGPLAALGAWAFHAGVDWLWEMPAVSLPALALAALLVAQSDVPTVRQAPPPPAQRAMARLQSGTG